MYPISWETFLDPSDYYFLFAEERGVSQVSISSHVHLVVIRIHSASLKSCKILGWMLSGPGDLLMLNSLNLFRTFSSVTMSLPSFYLISCVFNFGISPSPSFVKKLEKNLDNVSAFSLSLLVNTSFPFSVFMIRSEIPVRVHSRLGIVLKYLRVVLNVFCYFLFLILIAFLVRFLTLFLNLQYSCYNCPFFLSKYLVQHLCFFLITLRVSKSSPITPLLFSFLTDLCGICLFCSSITLFLKMFHC